MKQPITATWIQAAVLASVALGCGSKGAVSIAAHVDSPVLSVDSGVLVTSLSGQFDLVLALGDLAPEQTSVQLGGFAVKETDRVLVESLALTSSETFPLVLEPGDEKRVRFVLEAGASVTEETGAALCAGRVRLSGTLSDTQSDGKQTLAESAPFEPDCP